LRGIKHFHRSVHGSMALLIVCREIGIARAANMRVAHGARRLAVAHVIAAMAARRPNAAQNDAASASA
jgi:hypothetical protein